MIAARGIEVRAGDVAIVDGVDLEVRPGEVVALIGPNGAGKSTLLRVLAGDLSPHQGSVMIGGDPIARIGAERLARHRAMLPQHSALDFPFTALEVALLGRVPFGGTSAEDTRIARRALERAGVAHLAARSYPTLSGGERQRVQLARILAQLASMSRPRLLLLDEPTSSLDQSHAHHVLDLAEEIAAEETAVVVVLHDLHLASQHASRVVVLAEGRCRAEGPPAAVLEPALVREVFQVEALRFDHPALRAPALVTLPRSRGAHLEEAS